MAELLTPADAQELADLIAAASAAGTALSLSGKNTKAGFGLRLPVYGIFEHQDAVGLDLVLAIQEYVNQDLAREPHAHASLRKMVASGELGRKSGQGYYDWSKKSWDEVREQRDRFILEFLKAGLKQ